MKLEIKNVEKMFGDLCILSNCSTTLYQNHTYLLVGKNGAGKSTLINILGGNINMDSGNCLFVDEINESYQSLQDNLVIQYQNFNAFPNLKVKEVIELFRSSSPNISINMELYKILEIDLIKNKLLKVLSGGEKKAVSILIAMMHQKAVMIFDEPFNELDAKKKQLLKKYFTSNVVTNKIIVVISHEVKEFMDMFTDIIVMHEGKIVSNLSKEEMIDKYKYNQLAGVEGLFYDLTGSMIEVI